MGRIVVGIDGSDGSRKALEWAIAEASLRNAVVEAIHVWMFPVTPYVYAAPGAFIEQDWEKVGRELLQKEVETVTSQVANDVVVEQVVSNGRESAVLVEHSKGADLVVVGSRGRGGFTGLLLGSVSRQVVDHAHCPVVVVKDHDY